MGTPEYAQTILASLFAAGYPICQVISQPNKKTGRGQKILQTPVAKFATQHGLNLFQPDTLKTAEAFENIKQHEPDFIVVAAYGKIIPQNILDIPKSECLNVHASLLPSYRGASPIHYAILNGDQQTGVSIMKVIAALDAGPVYKRESLPIFDTDNIVSLTQKLATLGAQVLLQTLEEIQQHSISAVEQDSKKVSYATKIKKDMAHINWHQPAQKIFNQVRALADWPVAQTTINDMICKIWDTEILKESSNTTPGTITHLGKQGWAVATTTTDLLIKEVQLQNKNRMRAFDIANGLRLKSGILLGNSQNKEYK